jgi:hypothetical protein
VGFCHCRNGDPFLFGKGLDAIDVPLRINDQRLLTIVHKVRTVTERRCVDCNDF